MLQVTVDAIVFLQLDRRSAAIQLEQTPVLDRCLGLLSRLCLTYLVVHSWIGDPGCPETGREEPRQMPGRQMAGA